MRVKMKTNFEIVDIAGEFLAIPVGEESKSFGGLVALSESAAFLLKQLKDPKTETELVELLCEEYDVDYSLAIEDVHKILLSFNSIGLIEG